MRLKSYLGMFFALFVTVAATTLGLRSGLITPAALHSISAIVGAIALVGTIFALFSLYFLRKAQASMSMHMETAVSALQRRHETEIAQLVQSMGRLEARLQEPNGRDAQTDMTVRPAISQAGPIESREKPERQNRPHLVEGGLLLNERLGRDVRELAKTLETTRAAFAPFPISLQPVMRADTCEVAAYLAHLRLAGNDLGLDRIEVSDSLGSEASLFAVGRCVAILRDHFKTDPAIKILCPLHTAFFTDADAIGSFIDIFDRAPDLKGKLVPVICQPDNANVRAVRDAVQRLNHAGIPIGVRTGQDGSAGWLTRLASFLLADSDSILNANALKGIPARLRVSGLIALEADTPDLQHLAGLGVAFVTSRIIAPARMVKTFKREVSIAS